MEIEKQSFLSQTFGKESYDNFRKYAILIASIGTVILGVILGLTAYCHSTFVSNIFSYFSGLSLLFLIYIVAMIRVLDIQVKVIVPDAYEKKMKMKVIKSVKYRLTIVWAFILVLMGIAAVYFSNRYRKTYAFECETFLVDPHAKIYHLSLENDCEEAEKAEVLKKMQGYQIDDSYNFCYWCEEWAEEAEEEGESLRYFRR